jgi:hypothetical protein
LICYCVEVHEELPFRAAAEVAPAYPKECPERLESLRVPRLPAVDLQLAFGTLR